MEVRRHVPFFGNADTARFCYLRAAALDEAIGDERIVDGLVKQLEVPGKPAVLKAMSAREKLAAVEHQIETFRSSPTSIWRGVNPAEVLAASIFRASLGGALPQKVGTGLWHDVKNEEVLAAPVAVWLRGYKLTTYKEVPLGMKRADLFAYRDGGFFGETLSVVVELKNDYEQLKRGLDQMTTFAQYAHETYLACTPYFAADYLDRHSEGAKVRHWEANVLREKLEAFGFGLLLVEGERVYEVMKPMRRAPRSDKTGDVKLALKTARQT